MSQYIARRKLAYINSQVGIRRALRAELAIRRSIWVNEVPSSSADVLAHVGRASLARRRNDGLNLSRRATKMKAWLGKMSGD
jgi:hypothetical protein